MPEICLATAERLLKSCPVLDRQPADTGQFVAGDYSIADIAIFPWIVTHKAQGLALTEYPYVADWFGKVRARPAVSTGMDVLRELRTFKKNHTS